MEFIFFSCTLISICCIWRGGKQFSDCDLRLTTSLLIRACICLQIVAIKQLNHDGLQGSQEFIIEVLMLSLLHHANLTSLIGYCADGDEKLLVYEYMPKGSVEDHLFGK